MQSTIDTTNQSDFLNKTAADMLEQSTIIKDNIDQTIDTEEKKAFSFFEESNDYIK